MIWGEEPDILGPRYFYRNTLVIREIEKFKNGRKVLDFGAGSGHLLERLLGRNYICLAMDDSELAVKKLREKLKRHKLVKNAKIVKGDEKLLSAIRKKFDLP